MMAGVLLTCAGLALLIAAGQTRPPRLVGWLLTALVAVFMALGALMAEIALRIGSAGA